MYLSVCPMSTSQPRTAAHGQACTPALPRPSSNAGASICRRCPSCSPQTAGHVRPDGDHRRRGGSGFSRRTHPWPRHDGGVQRRKLGACQARRHLPGKRTKSQPAVSLEQLWGGLVLAGSWTVRAEEVSEDGLFFFRSRTRPSQCTSRTLSSSRPVPMK